MQEAELKCLVVEDEPAILRLIVVVLEDMGFEMLAATDAESALEIVSASDPDVVIADVRLPGMDGVELARKIKSSDGHASTPVLLMSAYAEPAGHPCEGFLHKPFDIDQLAEFVEPYLPID
jgi:CheY-like chemotaxis protein